MTITNIIHKLMEILSTAWGWAAGAAIFCASYFAGNETAILITLLAIVLDGAWGIAAALAQKKFALSELARDTVMKMSVYGSAIICFIGIDKLLRSDTGLTLAIVCTVIVLVEVWSMSASALICFPDMPFLRLLRKALAGEIARKLGVKPEDVLTELEAMSKKKAKR